MSQVFISSLFRWRPVHKSYSLIITILHKFQSYPVYFHVNQFVVSQVLEINSTIYKCRPVYFHVNLFLVQFIIFTTFNVPVYFNVTQCVLPRVLLTMSQLSNSPCIFSCQRCTKTFNKYHNFRSHPAFFPVNLFYRMLLKISKIFNGTLYIFMFNFEAYHITSTWNEQLLRETFLQNNFIRSLHVVTFLSFGSKMIWSRWAQNLLFFLLLSRKISRVTSRASLNSLSVVIRVTGVPSLISCGISSPPWRNRVWSVCPSTGAPFISTPPHRTLRCPSSSARVSFLRYVSPIRRFLLRTRTGSTWSTFRICEWSPGGRCWIIMHVRNLLWWLCVRNELISIFSSHVGFVQLGTDLSTCGRFANSFVVETCYFAKPPARFCLW